ncbi:MAG: GntR family transcriptional regulator [Solirubrobacteraceae bacterium]
MPVPDGRQAVRRELLRDGAYATLRDAIVSGTLAPGEHLHDDELCRWLGLSRTPLREALARLAEDGLVESVPQRYTRVTTLDVRDARHAFPLLAALHGLATELAVPRLEPDDVAALNAAQNAYVRALRGGDAAQAFDADDRFHQIFVERAGNPQVARMLERLLPALHRMEHLAIHQLPGRTAVAQHRAIIERAAAGNPAAAATAARANWQMLGDLAERELAAATTA